MTDPTADARAALLAAITANAEAAGKMGSLPPVNIATHADAARTLANALAALPPAEAPEPEPEPEPGLPGAGTILQERRQTPTDKATALATETANQQKVAIIIAATEYEANKLRGLRGNFARWEDRYRVFSAEFHGFEGLRPARIILMPDVPVGSPAAMWARTENARGAELHIICS